MRVHKKEAATFHLAMSWSVVSPIAPTSTETVPWNLSLGEERSPSGRSRPPTMPGADMDPVTKQEPHVLRNQLSNHLPPNQKDWPLGAATTSDLYWAHTVLQALCWVLHMHNGFLKTFTLKCSRLTGKVQDCIENFCLPFKTRKFTLIQLYYLHLHTWLAFTSSLTKFCCPGLGSDPGSLLHLALMSSSSGLICDTLEKSRPVIA